MQHLLTIFTPCYNRKHTLSRLYQSLLSQTNRHFVWLIVDDGSTDGTEKLITQYINENVIDIRFYKQNNSGKYLAHNKGVLLCDTTLFVCVDSDDYLKPQAVEFVLTVHENNSQKNLLAYVSRRSYPDGRLMGNNRYYKASYIGRFGEPFYKRKFSGDTMIVFRTEKIKNYAFPIFQDEKFATENILYYQLYDVAPALYLTESVYVGEYQEDGLSNNLIKLYPKNIKSCAYYVKMRAAAKFLPVVQRIRSGAHYYCLKKLVKEDIHFEKIKVNFFIKICSNFLAPFLKKKIKKLYQLGEY